jgi:hypothetical protein
MTFGSIRSLSLPLTPLICIDLLFRRLLVFRKLVHCSNLTRLWAGEHDGPIAGVAALDEEARHLFTHLLAPVVRQADTRAVSPVFLGLRSHAENPLAKMG